jgi:hypothetical protein
MTRLEAKQAMQRAMAAYAKTPSATNYSVLSKAILQYQSVVYGIA